MSGAEKDLVAAQDLNLGDRHFRSGDILTVCIPTYNRAKALDSCLFSICSQVADGKLPVQVVVSDNCSSDDTQEIVRKWSTRHAFVSDRRNRTNLGAVKNIWLVGQAVKTPFLWLMGDDTVVVPGAISHVLDILQAHPGLQLLLAAGTNDASEQTAPVRAMVEQQGEVVVSDDPKSFLCGFWLQTLGYISNLVVAAVAWKRTGFLDQPSYFIYPQVRSVLDVAAAAGQVGFSNRCCVLGYKADARYNSYYIEKAPISITVEFPWLQRYARSLGLNTRVAGGLHRQTFVWKLKQWTRMLVAHPYYSSLYIEAEQLEGVVWRRSVLRVLRWVVVPLRKPLSMVGRRWRLRTAAEMRSELGQSV